VFPIFAFCVNSCWRLFKAAILVALAAGVGAAIYYVQHLNDEIRARVLARIQGHYTHLKIEIRSAQLISGEGLLIRGVTISDPVAVEEARILFQCDEVLLACNTDLADLASGEPEFQRITVRRPQLFARVTAEGGWNLAKLAPAPQCGKRKVPIEIEGGVVEILDPQRSPAARFTFRDLQAVMTPQAVSDYLAEPAWEARGRLRGDHLQQIEFSGRMEPFGTAAALSGSVSDLNFNPEFTAALPGNLAELLKQLNPLSGMVNLSYEASYTAGAPRPWNFEVVGKLANGRISDPRFHKILSDVTADFRADPTGLMITDLLAQNGDTQLKLAAERRGYDAKAPMTIALEAKNLVIGREWESSLPVNFRDAFQKFAPAGIIDVVGQLEFDGVRWKPSGRVRCVNVSFTYHKFPYRLDRTTGVMELRDQTLTANLIATADGRPIQITGEIQNPGNNFTGRIQLSGKQLVMDQSMLAALPEKPREVVNSLHLAGAFNFQFLIQRDRPDEPKPHLRLLVELTGCTARYEKFPYPLAEVYGTVEMLDQQWSFRDLRGQNDTGRVTLEGSLFAVENGTELRLTFTGTEIPLEQELCDALPERARNFWRHLKPQGSLDLKSATVRYLSAEKKTEIQITAVPLGDTVTIEPDFFPLRLEKVKGLLKYRSGRIEFENMTAEQERLPVAASGYCEYDEQGAWHARFDKLIAERVHPERQTIQTALPAKLRKLAQAMRLTGALQIDGTLDVWGNLERPQSPVVAWDWNVDVRDASISNGVTLEHVDGAIRLTGQTDGARLRAQGELNLDSLVYKELQFTQIRGPFWIDESQAIFGSQAAQQKTNQPPRHLSAKCYGGAGLADIGIIFDDTPRYTILTRIDDADLAQFGRDQMPGKQALRGKVQIGMELRGTNAGTHTLAGRGQIHLHDADIYELPVMVAMLKLLSAREPDRSAFDVGDIQFRIEGEHIYFDSIELSGNAISLLGTGEMNLQREMKLVFAAVAGRSEWQLPVFKSMLGSASQQFMEIHVGGSLADPEISRESFPGLKQTLDQLQAERRERRLGKK